LALAAGFCVVSFLWSAHTVRVTPQNTDSDTQIRVPDDTKDQPPSIRQGIARGKAAIYQQAEAILFAKTRAASHNGTIIRASISLTLRAYIDVLILSLDGKAAWAFCATRGSNANFPCAKCLVPQDQQNSLSAQFPLRNTDWMRRVYFEAQSKKTKKDKEHILKSHGLHDVEVHQQCHW
jgi:hypothetical protein